VTWRLVRRLSALFLLRAKCSRDELPLSTHLITAPPPQNSRMVPRLGRMSRCQPLISLAGRSQFPGCPLPTGTVQALRPTVNLRLNLASAF
jgi:hypothetical protein